MPIEDNFIHIMITGSDDGSFESVYSEAKPGCSGNGFEQKMVRMFKSGSL